MTQPDDQKQQPQSDLGSELRELGQQIEEAVRSAITSDRAKQIQADISSGMKEIAHDFQETLARGIALLNDQLAEFAARMRQATDSTPPAGDASSTPPAADAPATGETTRLDPDKQ
jgi:heparin binding hemagglutinin HbhA